MPEQAGDAHRRARDQPARRARRREFAGDALKDKKRVFGVVHYDTIDGQQTAAFAQLKKALNDGGVKIAADLPFLLDLAKAQENARTMIAKLKDGGRHQRHLHR